MIVADEVVDKVTVVFGATGYDRLVSALTQANAKAEKARGTFTELQAAIDKMGDQGVISAKQVEELSRATQNAFKRTHSAASIVNTALTGTADATTSMADHLPRLRYALYDVSTTFAFAGAAMLGLGVAAAGTAITMDRQFADVIRTAGTYTDKTGESTDRLRDSFDNLFSTLPANWGTLTQIGTLAGQLGVAAENADEFTSLIVKMVTTTDLSAEQAATSMARLAELLDVSAGQYENLGSSILATGTASIATETQITRTATEIASMGDFAGFSADQVIGLSSALASLGVQPELARGIITRLFTNISVAIANGGDRLEAFGRIAGTTGQQFAQAWGTDAAGALQQLLTGLGQLEGTEATTTLQDLGITASRDIPTILKLAQNHKLLAEQMQIASDGFDQGTALQEQYGVVAQTVAEKLNVLKNNVQLLIAEAGDSQGVLSDLVDVLIRLVDGLRSFGDSPVAKILIGMALAASVFGGAALIATGAMARFTASTAAVATAKVEMVKLAVAMGVVETEAQAASMSLNQLIAATVGATVGTRGLTLALRSLKVASVVGAVAVGFELIWDQFNKVDEMAVDLTTDVEGLRKALAEDTKNVVENGASSFASYTRVVDEAGVAVGYLSTAQDSARQVGDGLEARIRSTSDAVQEQTVYVGDLTKEWLANELITGQLGQDLKDNFGDVQSALTAMGTDLSSALNAALTPDPSDGPDFDAYIQGLRSEQRAIRDAIAEYKRARGISPNASTAETDRMASESAALGLLIGKAETAKQVFSSLGGAISESATNAAINTAFMEALGQATGDAGGETRDFAEEMRMALEVITDVQSQMLNTESALASLGKGLQDGGLEWSQYTDAGRENLQNLMSVMDAMAKENEGNPLALAADYQALFQTLVNGGYASEKQLAILQQAIQSLLGQAGVKSVAASGKDFTSFFNGWASGADKAGRSTRKAAKEVRTLVDYANDLSKVWSRAFDIQFGPVSTMDAITSTFQDLRDAADEAARKVSGLKTEISGLETDLATQKYFLSIATLYNDDNRAREIQQNILELEEKLTDKKRELTDEQDAQSKALVGNTKAAIANRKTVMGLIQDYQEHVKALAASGMSAGQLSVAVDQLKSDFMSQALALGFSESELQNYVRALDGMKVAINGVPRNITVGASIDPAIQALNEFQAEYDKMRGSISQSPITIPVNTLDYSKTARGTALYTEMMSLKKGIEAGAFNYGPALRDAVKRVRDIMLALTSGNYWTGGFTGRGGMYDYAGAVHKGEYVIPKRDVNQSTGLPKAEALSRLSRGVPGRTGYAEGGFVTGLPGRLVVDLSGSSLQHLAGLVSKKLVIDGQVLGRTVNRSYESSARMGSN